MTGAAIEPAAESNPSRARGGWSDPAEGPGPWTARARCAADVPPTIMFTDIPSRAVAQAAMAFCTSCTVQADCLAYAQKWKLDGVWGGQLLQDGQVRLRRLRAPSNPPFSTA